MTDYKEDQGGVGAVNLVALGHLLFWVVCALFIGVVGWAWMR